MKRSVENELLAAVRRLQTSVNRLAAENTELKAVIAEKDKRIAELEADLAKLKKNSSTSSKPPSSDIVKPSRPWKRRGKRKIGGQPGHPKQERRPFSPEEIDESHDHELLACPCCCGPVRLLDDDPKTAQQVDLPKEPLPIKVREDRAPVYWCDGCETKVTAPMPMEIERGGLFGARLTAWVAYLKCACHASFSTIRKYLRDVLRIKVSRGFLAKVVQRVSRALDGSYNEVRERLPSEDRLNIDETGHKENGARFWTWCFRAEAYTFFKIAGTRSTDVLLEVLGREFDGAIGCDLYAAYLKFAKLSDALVHLCNAHLIRDVKYLTTLKAPATVAYGHRLLRGIRRLFRIIHAHDGVDSEELRKKLERQSSVIVALAVDDVPQTREARNMAERFRKHGHSYFEFITTPGMDPTNNVAYAARGISHIMPPAGLCRVGAG